MLPKLPRLRFRAHRDGSASYYFDHGGTPRRWQPLGKDERIARRRYDELIAAAKLPSNTVDRMLAEAIEVMRERGEHAEGTLLNYASYRKRLAAVFDDPFSITQADVLKYLATCPRKTFRNEVGLLSLAFVNWMHEGRLTFNPCFGVRTKRKGSKRTRLIAATELDAIITAADERSAVAIELAYATGLRIGDLIALRWADLAGVIELQKTHARQQIEGLDVLDPILARARALQARVASLYVLCDRRGRQWTDDRLRKRWNGACAAAGVLDAHFHDLRAAGATAVEKLAGVGAAQEFLGHADARTTAVYLRGLKIGILRPIRRKA